MCESNTPIVVLARQHSFEDCLNVCCTLIPYTPMVCSLFTSTFMTVTNILIILSINDDIFKINNDLFVIS